MKSRIIIVLAIFSALATVISCNITGVSDSAVINTIIEAAKKKDFDFFYNNSAEYRSRLQNIKESMPKFKQAEAEKNLYEGEKNFIFKGSGPSFYFPSGTGMAIFDLFYLFHYPSSWKIIETKHDKNITTFISYIEITYNIQQQSPHGNTQALVSKRSYIYKDMLPIRKLILEIWVDSKTGLFERAKGDMSTVVNW